MIQASRPEAAMTEQPRRPKIGVSSAVRSYRLLLIFGTAFGVACAYAAFRFQTPIYQSGARLLVTPEKAAEPAAPGEVQDSAAATQALVIRSPAVIREAVTAGQLGPLSSLAGVPDPAKRILEGLAVETPAGGSILELTYQGTDPAQCATILNAVIASYRDFLHRTQSDYGEDSSATLGEVKNGLAAQLRDKEAAYQKFRAGASVAQIKAADGENPHQARIAQIEAARAQLLIERIELKTRLDALRNERNGAPPEALPQVENGLDLPPQPPAAEPNAEVASLLLERQILLEDHGPDHPKVKAIDRRIELARRNGHHRPAEPGPRVPPVTSGPANPLASRIRELERELAASEARERELTSWLERESESARALATFQAEDAAFQREIGRLQQLFEQAMQRLDGAGPSASNRYRVQVVAAAEPGRRIAPNLAWVLSVGGAISALLSFAVACLLEFSDKRFRGPSDVEHRLGVYVLGHVPSATAGLPVLDPSVDRALVTYHEPDSAAAEAYRAARTALFFHTRDLPHKVIQVTGSRPGDGGSTLAANLSISIAQSGRTVLLIEADLRRPAVHSLFSLEGDKGIVPLLKGDLELRETIRPTPVENLWALPCGSVPRDPAELLSTAAFQELIEIARCTFDFVVIDTPAVLSAADAGIVSSRSNGIVLALSLAEKSPADAHRAISQLNTVGANVLGAIVNGIDEQRAQKLGYRGRGRPSRKRGAKKPGAKKQLMETAATG